MSRSFLNHINLKLCSCVMLLCLGHNGCILSVNIDSHNIPKKKERKYIICNVLFYCFPCALLSVQYTQYIYISICIHTIYIYKCMFFFFCFFFCHTIFYFISSFCYVVYIIFIINYFNNINYYC